MTTRAVLFDLDGTLYHQSPVRAAMALELGAAPVLRVGPVNAQILWRVLRTFRHVREELRAPRQDALLEDLQYAVTAERTGVDTTTVRLIVSEWMFKRPLRYLAATRRAGIIAALQVLRGDGVRVGVFSDYPTAAKLDALGLSAYVDQQICATDAVVNAFKPDPRGFLRACQQWGLPAASVVYVGDRPDVDAAGAEAAGMRSLIVGRRRHSGVHRYVPLPSFHRLVSALRHLDSGAVALTVPSATGNH